LLSLSLSFLDVQRQLAEAVAIVATYDFPDQWDTLLGLLATKLQQSNGDLRVVKGVMTTANSVMKRFRGAFKTDALFIVLKKCVDEFHTVLMATFAAVSARVHELSAGGSECQTQLVAALECLRLMSRIFFSLNWQVTGPHIPSSYPNTNTSLTTRNHIIIIPM
jgi:exportin-2 (importin alpha re-exporter)